MKEIVNVLVDASGAAPAGQQSNTVLGVISIAATGAATVPGRVQQQQRAYESARILQAYSQTETRAPHQGPRVLDVYY